MAKEKSALAPLFRHGFLKPEVVDVFLSIPYLTISA
jgi:hypothetical protein